MKKKAMSLLLAFGMLGSLLGIVPNVVSAEESEDAGVTKDGKFELALVTDVGTIDDRSFNQGSWEGVVKYAEENDVSHKYYRPTEQSDAAYEQAIDLAIQGGAKVVVTPGYLFEPAVFTKANQYKDIHFILIDGVPHEVDQPAPEQPLENVIAINYREEQAGYLAGYATVKEGYRKLGFMGGIAVPAVVRFGIGYVQGANEAAKELGLAKEDVTVSYTYTGSFEPKPEIATQAKSWYQSGMEVIFSCGGGICTSIMGAAEEVDKKVIGVDVDQFNLSEKTVLTSAMKNIQLSVYEAIKAHYDGTWKGEVQHLGAEHDMVLIALEHKTFKNFTEEDYKAIYEKLKKDELKVENKLEAENGDPTELNLDNLVLDFVAND